jgi:hypothetical protein
LRIRTWQLWLIPHSRSYSSTLKFSDRKRSACIVLVRQPPIAFINKPSTFILIKYRLCRLTTFIHSHVPSETRFDSPGSTRKLSGA